MAGSVVQNGQPLPATDLALKAITNMHRQDSTSSMLCSETTSAVAKVFGIAELLEGVLHNLSFRELLTAQRISKTFGHHINDSLKLRLKLFLSPVPRLSDKQDAAERDAKASSARHRIEYSIIPVRPPCWSSDKSAELAKPDTICYDAASVRAYEDVLWNIIDSSSILVTGWTPSWRQMYPAQPPPKRMTVEVWQKKKCSSEFCWLTGTMAKKFTIQHEVGITLGQMFDIVLYGELENALIQFEFST